MNRLHHYTIILWMSVELRTEFTIATLPPIDRNFFALPWIRSRTFFLQVEKVFRLNSSTKQRHTQIHNGKCGLLETGQRQDGLFRDLVQPINSLKNDDVACGRIELFTCSPEIMQKSLIKDISWFKELEDPFVKRSKSSAFKRWLMRGASHLVL